MVQSGPLLTVQAAQATPQSFFDYIMIFCAEYLWLICVVAAVLYVAYLALRGNLTRPKALNLGVATVFIAGVSYLLAKLGGAVISDPRPFLTPGESVRMLIPASIDNGFPSDHTLIAASVAAIIFTRNRIAGSVLAVLAVIVGLARVYCGVHHLADIAGSMAIVALVLIGYYIGGKLAHRPVQEATA